MKIKLPYPAIVLSLLLYAEYSFSAPYFQSCSDVLSKKEFQPLAGYFDSQPDQHHPDQCFRLNNNQFLVTEEPEGLFLYDKNTNSYTEDVPGMRVAIEINKEFYGENNKHYVIIYNSNTNFRYADWWQEYSILNLVPAKDGKPYIRYKLVSWEEDPAGLCGNVKDDDEGSQEKNAKEKLTKDIKEPQIINEGTSSVKIIFSVKEKNCISGVTRNYKKEFSLSYGVFKETE